MSRRLGILGGAFDPIHYGHLLLAAEAHYQLELDKVLFMPTFKSAHKHKEIGTPYQHRLAMLKLALAKQPEFAITEIEKKLGDISYTVKSLAALHQEQPEAEFFFLVGADNVEQLKTWFEPERLTELATLAVVARPGHQLPIGLSEKVVKVEMPLIEISASAIRGRVKSGASIRFWTPREVEDYIASEGLYCG